MKFEKSGGFYRARFGTLEIVVLGDLMDDTWRLMASCDARTEAHSWLVQMRLTNVEYPTPEAAMAAADIIVPPLVKQLTHILGGAQEEKPKTGVPALRRIVEDET